MDFLRLGPNAVGCRVPRVLRNLSSINNNDKGLGLPRSPPPLPILIPESHS